jgi:tetratricopeptide (TPR) repeat protein
MGDLFRVPPAQHSDRTDRMVRLLIAIGLLGLCLWLVATPDPRDDLRYGDDLFRSGRYYEALQTYRRIAATADLPEVHLRLGMIATLRGETDTAEDELRRAMQQGLAGTDYYLALAYLGQALAADGRTALAQQTWSLAAACRTEQECTYRGPIAILQAETLLAQEDYADATMLYRIAMAHADLGERWQHAAQSRLALLTAPHDPQQALRLLADSVGPTIPDNAWLAPLVPHIDTTALVAALSFDPGTSNHQRALGQYYVSQGFYRLAEEQFTRAAAGDPDALLAATAYAAYNDWRQGAAEDGLTRLEAQVAANPDDTRAQTLLAMIAISRDAGIDQATQIAMLEQLDPELPDTRLAWAGWYTSQREYALAADAYTQAVGRATEQERGRYALIAARFHLATRFALCERGLPLAESAHLADSNNHDATLVLAAHLYHCERYQEAVTVARQAFDQRNNPEAAYYLGAALAFTGNYPDAREALLASADLAPASIWRVRAEEILARIQNTR